MVLEYITNRRTFLNILAAYALAGCAPFARQDTPQILYRYTVPDEVRKPNIKEIVDALASKVVVGNGRYVPQFVDLVQFVHHEMTGMTYAEHMERELRHRGTIDVVVEKGLYRRIRAPAEFIHGTRNEAYIDADMSPAYFLGTLNKELIHAVFGKGEIRSIAHTHRDLAYMTARYPELLRKKDEESPLINWMWRNIRNMLLLTLSSQSHPISAYFVLVDNKFNTEGAEDLDKAVEMTLGKDYPSLFRKLDDKLKAQLKQQGLEYLRYLIINFADKTEEYILRSYPDFPEDKKSLLKSKMERIRDPAKN